MAGSTCLPLRDRLFERAISIRKGDVHGEVGAAGSPRGRVARWGRAGTRR